MFFSRSGSALALLLLLVLSLQAVRAQTDAGKGNLLPPITGSQEWALTVAPPAKATLARQARAVIVTIATPGSQPWQAQLSHQGADLVNGQAYTLRFRAKADAPHPMDVFGGLNRPDYHDIGLSQTVALGADWKDYALTFTARNVVAGQVSVPEFRVGGQKGQVWLAGVTLIPSGHTAPVRAATPSAPGAAVDAVSPGLAPAAGETLLEGTIREMRPAQRQFVLLVTRRFAHGGAPKDIEPPRQQRISVRPGTGLQRLPEKAPSGKRPLATLQPGDRIAVLGKESSAAPLAARLIVIAAKGTTPASAPDAP